MNANVYVCRSWLFVDAIMAAANERLRIHYQNRVLRLARVFRPRFDILQEYSEQQIKDRFRLDVRSIYYLSNLLQPVLEHPTRRSGALSTLLQILVALRFYATGSFQITIGDSLRLSKATVCRCVHAVSAALCQFAGHFITWPAAAEALTIKEQFYALAGKKFDSCHN